MMFKRAVTGAMPIVLVGSTVMFAGGSPAAARAASDPPPARSVLFTYVGYPQRYQVPVGVTHLIVETWGAEGQHCNPRRAAGAGGYVRARVSVQPGQVLTI